MPRKIACAICNEPMLVGRGTLPEGEAAHNACRTSNGPLKHGDSAYRRGCRCQVCREAANARMRAYTKARMERDGVTPSRASKRKKRGVDPDASWDCYVCKTPLIKASRSGKYPMHKYCRNAAPEWVRRGLPNPKIKAFEDRIAKAALGTSGKRVFVAGDCDWCGSYFVAAGAKARFCSADCKTREAFKRRSSGQAFNISPRARTAIYERDQWTCQLCAYPVDATLHHLDNWAASLDHIIPQSHMLIPDHSPSNLRLVHRICNSLRGDGHNVTEAVFKSRIDEMWLAA